MTFGTVEREVRRRVIRALIDTYFYLFFYETPSISRPSKLENTPHLIFTLAINAKFMHRRSLGQNIEGPPG